MPSWNQLENELSSIQSDQDKAIYIQNKLQEYLNKISKIRNGTNVVLYGSGFLQKPLLPGLLTSMNHEDINGWMAMVHGAKCENGLTIILHTPGGIVTATETMVEYLRQKFKYIETIIPTYAMSAGTMMSLSGNKIIMGRQSQLGPIDPQIPAGEKTVSSKTVFQQFHSAKKEILDNSAMVPVWAPILQRMGPALVQEAIDALGYSQRMVTTWMKTRMLKSEPDPEGQAQAIGIYFNANDNNQNHGRRIDRDEARGAGLGKFIENLEDDSDLQDAALTVYHLMTLIFDRSPAFKFMVSSNGKVWAKNAGQ